MADYNYTEFSTGDYNLNNFSGPELGTKAPNFTLKNVNGDELDLLDFEGQFLVLELGSITCPLFQGRRGGMANLVEKYPNIDFAVLYVREAHPGKNIGSHQNIDQKIARASRLAEDGEGRLILVDDFEGRAHSAYGSYPNAVFIINKSGCVVFRADWNNPGATAKALNNLLSGKPANVKSYFRPVRPDILIKTMQGSGQGSLGDFLKGLPVLIWKNLIRRNFLLMFNRKPKVMPNTDC